MQKALAILQEYLRLKISGGEVSDPAHGPTKAEGVVFQGMPPPSLPIQGCPGLACQSQNLGL